MIDILTAQNECVFLMFGQIDDSTEKNLTVGFGHMHIRCALSTHKTIVFDTGDWLKNRHTNGTKLEFFEASCVYIVVKTPKNRLCFCKK